MTTFTVGYFVGRLARNYDYDADFPPPTRALVAQARFATCDGIGTLGVTRRTGTSLDRTTAARGYVATLWDADSTWVTGRNV